ncbi:MAG: hypothetical protein M1826_000635 [Phylliscum demangeonii]|nr:MAG: hypothetical protein M1826_000635 [Phylliscum demangeonii]
MSPAKAVAHFVGKLPSHFVQFERKRAKLGKNPDVNPGYIGGAIAGGFASPFVATIPLAMVAAAAAGDGLWQVAVDHRNPFSGKMLAVAPRHSDDLAGWPIGD